MLQFLKLRGEKTSAASRPHPEKNEETFTSLKNSKTKKTILTKNNNNINFVSNPEKTQATKRISSRKAQ
jgi:hypothetical protein